MIDEFTGKKIVSPLDLATPEWAIINMLAAQGKTVQESADFLTELAGIIKSPVHDICSKAFNQPLSAVIDSLEL